MPQMTISNKEVKEFASFLEYHNIERWFVAKDQGAYIGATANGERWLKYFKGCNPETDAEWYENAWDKFGGDDFGEFIEESIIRRAAERNVAVVLKVTDTAITATFKSAW